MTALAIATPDVAEVTPDGDLSYAQFHEGQRRAYHSKSRITLVLAGTQGGKTAVGPPWMLKQIQERGAGDYIVAAPTFALMEKKVLPEFLRLFRDCLELGEYKTAPVRKFVFSRSGMRRLWGVDSFVPTQIYFGYGEDPESLESMTARAAWLDEPGQKKFKRESYEAIMRRLSIDQGPLLLTTTPYLLGWLSELVEKAKELGVKVINFPSIANPRFSRAEWERAKRELPAWKFDMFYRGLFKRPAGMIYDCWSEANLIPWFRIPDSWPRFLGLDFGGVNTAGVFLAKEMVEGQPTGRFVAYREYHAGGKTAAGHAESLRKGEPMMPTAVGGSKSEGQWRDEFGAAGLGVWPPVVTEVEVGIQRVYGMIKTGQLVLLDQGLEGLKDEILGYSRILDERGEPTEAIEDKDTFHRLDALRYIGAFVAGGFDGSWVV